MQSRMKRPAAALAWAGAVALTFMGRPAAGLDQEHRSLAEQTIQRGVEFLRQRQNDDGSWMPQPGPAVTGMVVGVLLDRPEVDENDPAVAAGLAYLLNRAQPDGSIRDGADGILANYNTAIALSALSKVHGNPEAAGALAKAQDYLRGLQWTAGDTTPDGETIDADHPFFGGVGYGNHGRPDLSNLQFMLQGLRDSGVSSSDPAFQNALVFISRCQGIDANDFFPDGVLPDDGSFIYATSISKDLVGVPESKANPTEMDEAKAGRAVSGLRGYGSMTYAGFKSLLYADLDRSDPRVAAAVDWLSRHYTLEQNPGLPESMKLQGLYYYYMAQSRALAAWGSTTLTVSETADDETAPPADREVDWANALIDKLASLQREDGSFVNEADRWMEGDPDLVTAYALIALQEATR